jgi:hypothetical protein
MWIYIDSLVFENLKFFTSGKQDSVQIIFQENIWIQRRSLNQGTLQNTVDAL